MKKHCLSSPDSRSSFGSNIWTISHTPFVQQMQRLLWLLALLARADSRAVGDHVGQDASELQLLQEMQRLLWLLALLACADGRVVGDHVGQEALELHLLQRMQHLLGLWPFSHALMAAL